MRQRTKKSPGVRMNYVRMHSLCKEFINMKRRTYALILTLAVTASLLTACGPKDSGGESQSTPGSSVSTPGSSMPDGSTSTPDGSAPDGSAPDASKPQEKPPIPEPEVKEGLSLSSSDFTLFKAGSTYTLKATLTGMDKNTKVTFQSGNEKVATVDEKGVITAVAPGTAKITVTAGDLKATCVVRCRFEEDKPANGGSSSSGAQTPAEGQVDLAAFYDTVKGNYSGLGELSLLDSTTVENSFPGLSGVSTKQCLVYGTMMSMNMGEIVLVEVSDSKDVDTVKGILQARISTMVGDEENPGMAWYPEPTRVWQEESRVVSNGNYVMMVVGESCDTIVSSFNKLF